MIMTGAEMVVKALEKNGVKIVFGYPGAANCPIIDRLSFSSIKHILTRNEQGAAHMASGYARVTKTAGVCTATSGPGATNLITGIATAYMDSVPMVVLTGQVASPVIGKDAFQEVDITGATHPFTKHNYLVKDGTQIGKIINEAFYIANTGRPGPVVVDLPMDILKMTFDYPDERPEEVNIRGYKPAGKANEAQIKKIAAAVKASKKPLILAGGGIVISDAVCEFREFAKITGIPVVSTMNGIGVLECADKQYYGMVGSHGVKEANIALNRADLVIIAGARLSDRSVYNAQRLEDKTTLIHIDIDPAEIGKNMIPQIPVVGDIKDVITQLLPLIKDYKANSGWIEELDAIEPARRTFKTPEDTGFVNPKYFSKMLSQLTNSDVYISTEVGQNQLWIANNFDFTNPRSLITSAGFGTMGYGLPAAIGASTVSDKTVVAIMGDGSFQMDLPELGTMCQWDIPVKMVVFENKRLGMVHEHQYLLYKSNYQSVFLDGSPDFCKLADAYGIPSMKINENSEIENGINTMLNTKGSFLLVVSVNPNEPTGGSLNENVLPAKAN